MKRTSAFSVLSILVFSLAALVMASGTSLRGRKKNVQWIHVLRICFVRPRTALAPVLLMLLLGFHAPQAEASLNGDDVRIDWVFSQFSDPFRGSRFCAAHHAPLGTRSGWPAWFPRTKDT
jgi:hypothetical protein